MSCTTCQPMPTCLEGLSRYSLQDTVYPFVLNCPPGYDCSMGHLVPVDPTASGPGSNVGQIIVSCCNGQEFSADVPATASATDIQTIARRLLESCARVWEFCQPPENEPTGTP